MATGSLGKASAHTKRARNGRTAVADGESKSQRAWRSGQTIMDTRGKARKPARCVCLWEGPEDSPFTKITRRALVGGGAAWLESSGAAVLHKLKADSRRRCNRTGPPDGKRDERTLH